MLLIKCAFYIINAVCVFAQDTLRIDRKLSPPHSVPANPLDMYYTVPMNQTISKPIIIYIIDRNGTISPNGIHSNAMFTIESIDQYTSFNRKFRDSWAESGGKLCQNTIWWEDYPTRMDRSRFKVRCGEKPQSTVLNVQAFNGRIIVDWLYHEHSIIPNNQRIFRISRGGTPLNINTNPFRITEPANGITVISQPPNNVIANHDFSIVAEIRDRKGKRLTDGLDSIAFVELTVPYYYKTFYRIEHKEMLLKTASIRLSGEDVISHQSTNDMISRKRAVAGVVTFKRIRVLDAISDLKLNLTILMARDPWRRIPNSQDVYQDTKDYNLNADGTEISFRPKLSYKNYKSMTFTEVFRVMEQKLTALRFSNHTLYSWEKWENPKTKTISVSRNVIFPGETSIEAVDSSGEIIYSGSDASFQLIYETKPANVCISRDATKVFAGGQTFLELSICQIISDVQIIISPSHNNNISIATPHFKVGGKIYLAHFGDLRYSGDGAEIESHMNSFIKFGAYEVNRGFRVAALSKYGIQLYLKSYDTESDINKAFFHFGEIIRDDQPPSERIQVIISSCKDDITRNLNPELVKIHLPYISLTNTADVYANNDLYPYFTRVCWSETSITKSVITAMKDRSWKKIVIVRDIDATVGDSFRRFANQMDIDIKYEVIIPDFTHLFEMKYDEIKLQKEMQQIKSFGVKIIFLFAQGDNQIYILRAAYLAGLDSVHGYQWVLMSKNAWQFPFFNPGVCGKGPVTCTESFKGTVLFSETYNVTGYNTLAWIRVLGYFFSTDKYELQGGRVKYRPPEVGARIALGYDSVILFANALHRIISKQESISGVALAHNIKLGTFDGLTGTVSLNQNGDRTGYMAFIAQVWPVSKMGHTTLREVFIPVRLVTSQGEEYQYEIPYILNKKRMSINNGFYLIESKKYNQRNYLSTSGYFNPLTQLIVRHTAKIWPSRIILRQEKVVPPFYCTRDCGFKLLSEEDVNVYDTGRCTENGMCVCFRGYAGEKCGMILCSCRYGMCTTPKSCRCHPGWSGASCDTAICGKCVRGECVAPDICKCNSTTWTGSACDLHIAIILAPALIFSILLIIFTLFVVRNFIKRMRRNAALSKVDWIVEWDDVAHSLSSDTVVANRTSKSRMKMSLEAYTWKNEIWYVKFFNNKTIDVKDEEMCLEMVQLTKIRHRNVIIYGGACLTAPNVSLFLEVTPKGSLNDLLLNDTIELGWDFRYTFMKDICSGMRFLHENKNIGSHGRLKSHNCLVDSRWTIRISGFGAPSMRYGKYQNESTDELILNELLWTAPELLRVSKCLNDVKQGSQPGDIYSFAIVVAEIITRAEPYSYELGFMDVSNILDLILGNNYPGLKETRRTWEDIGGADMLTTRPILKNEFMPEKAAVRARFKKMLEDAWHENPFSRPTFETLMSQLNIIHPVTGELIDNLINLLESYSNNLEMIVVERTNELEANKARAEELLSQMLPANVTSELKRGRKVPPESYDCASVFFSDIVDFARICQQSTPLQIVALLNETYNVFDEVLDEYDVYKVETISDSYMVVSGVPLENENRHAGEICTMALDLMSTVTNFQIPHRPKATLQLRIGVHSGPVVSGVVGVLMPRYCLFGDTVNTASRMMSSSHALCIQISDRTAGILEELGGYDLQCRGERTVKGRGVMVTYWLWGKDTFRKRLPDQSLAISISQHKFK